MTFVAQRHTPLRGDFGVSTETNVVVDHFALQNHSVVSEQSNRARVASYSSAAMANAV